MPSDCEIGLKKEEMRLGTALAGVGAAETASADAGVVMASLDGQPEKFGAVSQEKNYVPGTNLLFSGACNEAAKRGMFAFPVA